MWPLSLATGATSAGSSASVWREKPSGTFQMKTLPSSEAEEMSESLKGDLWAVSMVRGGSRVGVPVGVEDGSRVATEERQLVGGAAALVDGNDSKGAATAGFPVDGDVLGVGLGGVRGCPAMVACGWAGADLDQVGVPGILCDAQVIVALFLGRSAHARRGGDGGVCVPSLCLCQRHGLGRMC